MKVTFEIDDEAAAALGFVLRRMLPRWIEEHLQPEEHGIDLHAWDRAVSALSPKLPPPKTAKPNR